MNQYVAMLKKEWIEYRYLVRIPLWSGLCALALLVALFMNTALQENLLFEMRFGDGFTRDGLSLGNGLSTLTTGAAALLSLLISTMYFPKTLRKPRQEGSLMFWRSMPVSDAQNHLVKLIFGLVVIPAVCACLVLGADILLWLMNMVSGQQLTLALPQASLSFSLIHWLGFLARMLWAGVLMVPLVFVALALSQRVNSPILVMFVAVYALKWGAIGVFNYYGVSEFFSAVFAIPMHIMFSDNPLSVLSELSWLAWALYLLIGIIAASVSLQLSKTVE